MEVGFDMTGWIKEVIVVWYPESGDSKYDKRNGGCKDLGKGGVPNPEILENFICAYPLMPN